MDNLPPLRNTDPMLRFIEFYAVRNLYADHDDEVMQKCYPDDASVFNERLSDFSQLDSSDWRYKALDSVIKGQFDSMQDVYAFLLTGDDAAFDPLGIDALLEPVSEIDDVSPMGPAKSLPPKSEINKAVATKRSIAREKYMRDKLGEAFVPTDVTAKAKQLVAQYVLEGGSREGVAALVPRVLSEPSVSLTDSQKTVLLNEVMLAYYDRLMVHDTVEAELLNGCNALDGQAFYLWNQIKRRYEKDKPFQLSNTLGSKFAACSKSTYPKVIQRLIDLKALRRLDRGQSNAAPEKRKVAEYLRLL